VEESNSQRNVPSGWHALEEVGFAACILDRRLRYRRANTAWKAFLQGDTFRFGRRDGVWRNREMLADIPEERREHWTDALRAIVRGQLGHFFDRMVEQHALGHRLVVTTANPTLDADGKIDGVLCVRYDVTEAQRAEENQQRLTDALLAARRLQHYLGNQLALTLGYVELLTLDPRLPTELRERVDEALRGVVEATETLSRLRLVTRLEIDHDDPSLEDRLGPNGAPP
jgi:hypothetical protein